MESGHIDSTFKFFENQRFMVFQKRYLAFELKIQAQHYLLAVKAAEVRKVMVVSAFLEGSWEL